MYRSFDIFLVPQKFPSDKFWNTTVIVIDNVFATTTALWMLEAGAASVIPKETVAQAYAALNADPALLLAGEERGKKLPRADFDNLPMTFLNDDVRKQIKGQDILLRTSNGSKAILWAASAGAKPVILASLNNVNAAVAKAMTMDKKIVVLCAGEAGKKSIEDILCAGAIAEILIKHRYTGQGDDAAEALELYRKYRNNLFYIVWQGATAQLLRRNGMNCEEDIRFACRRNRSQLVPVYRRLTRSITLG